MREKQNIRQLRVDYTGGDTPRTIGVLARIDRRIGFDWDDGFLADPLPLAPFSPSMRAGVQFARPDAQDGLFGLFADALPDAWGRLVLRRAARRAGETAPDVLDMLARLGERGAGALRFYPAQPVEAAMPRPLDDLAADGHALTAGVDAGVDVANLDALRVLGGSSGGARPKLQIGLHGNEPDFSGHDWIVKFNAHGEAVESGAREGVYADLARSAGIAMSEVRLLPSAAGPGWFATRRFDRRAAGRPVHFSSLAGLLDSDFRHFALGYSDYLKVILHLTRDQRAVAEGFRRIVFNILMHNRDDHARNHGFLWDGTWRLAPAYDLTFADGPGGEHSMDIAGEGRAPSRADLMRLAREIGITKRIADTEIDRVWSATATATQDIKAIGGADAEDICARLEAVRVAF